MANFVRSLLILHHVVLASTSGGDHVMVMYAQVGEKVTITPVTGHAPFSYVYWWFGRTDRLQLGWRNHLGGQQMIKEKLWDNIVTLSDNSLVISNVQQENFGYFVCETIFKDRSTNSSTFRLDQLTVSASPTTPLLPGDSLSLSCSVQPPGSGEIFWLNPREEKQANADRGALTIRATGRDHGQWTCVVGRGGRATISITVLDLSPAPLGTVYTSATTALTVPCSLPAHVTWKQIREKGGQDVRWHFFPEPRAIPQTLFSLSLKGPLQWSPRQGPDLRPASDPETRVLSLSRRYGREGDGGAYVCSVAFGNGVTLNRTVRVEVLQIHSSQGTVLTRGRPLNLTCRTGHPLPSDLRLEWTPPGRSSLLPLGSERHTASLAVPQVLAGDAGDWGCALRRGETQLTSAVITLNMEPYLSVWMLVIICGVGVIVILLGLLIFIFCRRRNRKVRHLRHELCRCKNPKPKGFYRT